MAHDLLFSDDTDADWARSPSVAAPHALALDFTATERKTLKLLKPKTTSVTV